MSPDVYAQSTYSDNESLRSQIYVPNVAPLSRLDIQRQCDPIHSQPLAFGNPLFVLSLSQPRFTSSHSFRAAWRLQPDPAAQLTDRKLIGMSTR